MANKGQSANSTVYILLAVVCAILCAAMAWMYFDYKQRSTASHVAYARFGPMIVRNSEFSIRATVAVQTRNADISWFESNKGAVNFALQAALAKADPSLVRKPDGVAYVQGLLRDSINGRLGTQAAQDIVLTDFLIQQN